jgi:hypothetical protein
LAQVLATAQLQEKENARLKEKLEQEQAVSTAIHQIPVDRTR